MFIRTQKVETAQGGVVWWWWDGKLCGLTVLYFVAAVGGGAEATKKLSCLNLNRRRSQF